MIVYRTQASTGDSWVTHWDATLEDARRTRADLEDVYADVALERVEVGTGHRALVDALNAADANRSVWPGEKIQNGG